MVQATSEELDAWRRRDLSSTAYKFLYLDGAYFSVRRGKGVERLPFLCVIGVRADDEKMEVLAIEALQLTPNSLLQSRLGGILAASASVPALAVSAVWCS